MDTLFSTYQLSGSRLARLISAPPFERASLIDRWYPGNTTQEKGSYNFYRMARTAVVQFHRRNATEGELRSRAEEWRFQAQTTPEKARRAELESNARALIEYLDFQGQRRLVIMEQEQLEAYVERIRIRSRPHFTALAGPRIQWTWIECCEKLAIDAASTKAHVSRLIATLMGRPASAQVELLHPSTRQLMPFSVVPSGLEVAARAVCRQVHARWKELDDLQRQPPKSY
jgi:hypothetical protein